MHPAARTLCLLAATGPLGACMMAEPPTVYEPINGQVSGQPYETPVTRHNPGSAELPEAMRALYGARRDNGHQVDAIPGTMISGATARREVGYDAPYRAGTIVVDPTARKLYHLAGGNRATRYTVGVGAAGMEFTGEATVQRQSAWPRWTPTPEMLRRDPAKYGPVRGGLPGGPKNPLGARALYLYQNGQDTLYRIHGTPHPGSVGHASSAGCIRMFNQDVIHLANRVAPDARVVVLEAGEANKWVQGASE